MKKIPPAELDRIVEALGLLGGSANLSTLAEQLGGGETAQKLRRRLHALNRQGKVHMEGRTRGAMYALTVPADPSGAASTRPVKIQLMHPEEDTTPLRQAKAFTFTVPMTAHLSQVQSVAGRLAVDGQEAEEEKPYMLSPAAEVTRRLVTREIAARPPATYRREFLDSYTPNVSTYLPAATRAHLAKLARTPEEHQPAGTFARQVLERLLIDLSFYSSKLEGNTYSILETEALFANGVEVDGKPKRDALMLLNHKEAIAHLITDAERIDFDKVTIGNLHANLTNGLLPHHQCGRVRREAIGITRSTYLPLNTWTELEACYQLLLLKAKEIKDPFEQSLFALIHIPYLQAFRDGNKRTGRLSANIQFLRANLKPLSFVDVPHDLFNAAMFGVYELNRADLVSDLFVWAYERSSAQYDVLRESLGMPDEFLFRFRGKARTAVSKVISEAESPQDGERILTEFAASHLPADIRMRFVATVLAVLADIHEGNFQSQSAVDFAAFTAWRSRWGGHWGDPQIPDGD